MINLEMVEMYIIRIVHAVVLKVVRKHSGLTCCVLLSFFHFSLLSIFAFLVVRCCFSSPPEINVFFFCMKQILLYCSIVQLLELPESHYSNVFLSHNEMLSLYRVEGA